MHFPMLMFLLKAFFILFIIASYHEQLLYGIKSYLKIKQRESYF